MKEIHGQDTGASSSRHSEGGPEAPARADETPLRVLIGDVDTELLEVCERIVEHQGHECQVTGDREEVWSALARGDVDLALVYEGLPGMKTEALLRMSRDSASGALVVVTSEEVTPGRCRQAMQLGAWDYLPKPSAAGQLLALLGRAAYTLGQARKVHGPARKSGVLLENGLTILGVSGPIRSAVEKALRVASTDAPVLLTGESGTGKELFARLIHEHSRRLDGDFVPVNCAALPGELLESEMFGHRRGAFTGAVRDKPGILETAHQGTVFLDELGEMPVNLQAKLLRVVQDGSLRRVGSEQADRTVDVRILSATNRDPEEALASGHLREDLLYRLGVVSIHLAPLRDRPDDIPALVHHFTPMLWNRYRPSGGPAPIFTDEAVDALLGHPWPGNVRELENVVGNAVIFAKPGEAIRADDLPFGRKVWACFSAGAGPEGRGTVGRSNGGRDAAFDPRLSYHDAKDRMLGRFERAYISRLVARADGNLCEAARQAQINRATLYRLMEKHGLSRETLTDAVPRKVGANGSNPEEPDLHRTA